MKLVLIYYDSILQAVYNNKQISQDDCESYTYARN